MENHENEKLIKGKLKKLRKKIQHGNINTRIQYLECLTHGLSHEFQFPRFEFQSKNNENQNMKYDYTIQDIQDLMTSIVLLEESNVRSKIPMINKPFIRHITILELDDHSSPNSEDVHGIPSFFHSDDKEFTNSTFRLKVSNSQHPCTIVDKLFSLSFEESNQSQLIDIRNDNTSSINDNVRVNPKLSDYIMSEMTMRLWGFPLSLEQNQIIEQEESTNTNDKEIHQSKRIKTTTLNDSLLPSLCESIDFLASLPKVSVRSKNDSSLISHYFETCPKSILRNLHPTFEVIAIDCEMCLTSNQVLELTRVTVLSQHHEVILDEYVKPLNEIIDYKTQYSGMTKEILEPVTTRIEQIQTWFLRNTTRETLFIGHSLDSDLHALKLSHKKCIDTAILYPHPKWFPYRLKLKQLAKQYLKKSIQDNSIDIGHDSIEDAKTALELVNLKVSNGKHFGNPNEYIRYRRFSYFNEFEVEKLSGRFYWDEVKAYETHVEKLYDIGGVSNLQSHVIESNVSKRLELFYKPFQSLQDDKEVLVSYLRIKSNELTTSLSSFINSIQSNISQQTRTHGLLITISQPNDSKIVQLQQRKKICLQNDNMCTSIWTKDLELEFQREVSYYHHGMASLVII